MPTIELYCAPCLEVLSRLGRARIGAVIADPPYGIDHDTDYTRFPGKTTSNAWERIDEDDQPFDPAPWLNFPVVALFGANCFSDRLPMGSLLVWIKRREDRYGKMMSDAEVVWLNKGHGVYLFQHEWDGFMKASERGQKRLHPTQKPVAVVEWVIERARLKPGTVILDPYMGSGTTCLAALKLGHSCIGIEKNPARFEVAKARILAEVRRTALLEPVTVTADDTRALIHVLRPKEGEPTPTIAPSPS